MLRYVKSSTKSPRSMQIMSFEEIYLASIDPIMVILIPRYSSVEVSKTSLIKRKTKQVKIMFAPHWIRIITTA